jgi:hypothetical protein
MNSIAQSFFTMHWFLAFWAGISLSGLAAADKVQDSPGHVIIGDIALPFDKTIEVVGPCVTDERMSLGMTHAEASLLGLRVEGRANQENVEFHLFANSKKIGEQVKSLKKDDYYKVRGRIAGARTSGNHRVCNFKVEHVEAVDAVPLTPADFVGRIASFEGVATARDVVQLPESRSHVTLSPALPAKALGKQVSVRGKVDADEAHWKLLNATWKLVNLEDMTGEVVSLDGTLWSLNDHWWFDYRGEKIYLTSQNGPPLTFEANDHGRLARVTGTLVRQLRPSLDQITARSDRDLVPTFVVRGAQVVFQHAADSWHNRFGTVYDAHRSSNGVPELIAEGSYRRNLLGNESTAMLFRERNHQAINEIVSRAAPESCNVLASRMNDAKVDGTLRLLYAAILARMNDERGRDFLLKAAKSRSKGSSDDVYYCLGIFPFLGTNGKKPIATDVRWAEATLTEIMSDPAVAEEAARYSSIPVVLANSGTPSATQALLNYALKTPDESTGFFSGPSVLTLLCEPSVQLPAKDLLRLEAVAKDAGPRRAIMRALLRLKHPAAADHFLNEFDDAFVYMDFRDTSSPEVLKALAPQVPQLTGRAKSHAEMLLVLGAPDPVPTLLDLLNDSNYTDKNLVMFELARLADDRAVKPVASILREAPRDYFGTAAPYAIQRALKAIAKPNTRDSVRELDELLGTDLARFGGYIDREGFQRTVAAHLIEMTGESFGVDQTSWREWESAQTDERFRRGDARSGNDRFREDPDARIDLGR